MDEPRDNTPSKVVNIAKYGDVILVVGLEQAKLRVQSLFLKAASKPFSAMFGPDWKEGHDILNPTRPVELSLPEDNASALKLICAIIHHRNKAIPKSLAAVDILEVAVTADKYDCVCALKFARGNWLKPGKKEAGDLMLLTAAAYLFQKAQAFNEITRALILNHHGPYLTLLCEEVESTLPWKVFCMSVINLILGRCLTGASKGLLEEQRSCARLKVAAILIAGINEGVCVHRCGWTSKYAYAYLKLLGEKELWPASLLQISVSKAVELAKTMPDPIPEESSIACTYEYKHATPEYRRGRRGSLDSWTNNVGLCLHCVRSDNTDSHCSHGSYST